MKTREPHWMEGAPDYTELSLEEETDLIRLIEARNILLKEQKRSNSLEECECMKRGNEAREKLILNTIYLVRSICLARSRHDEWIDQEDLFSEGVEFLIKHVDRIGHNKGHDWRKGIKFSTYLSTPLRFNISAYILKQKTRHRAMTLLRNSLSKKPWSSVEALEPKKENRNACRARMIELATDKLMRRKGEETPLHATLNGEKRERREILLTIMQKKISEEYYDILTRLFGIGRDAQTPKEIAEEKGCSSENILQKRDRALYRLEQSFSREEARLFQEVFLDRSFDEEPEDETEE